MSKRNNCLDKSAIILEARTQSKRFPNKVFKNIGNYKLLHFLLKRLSRLKNIKIIVATTKNPKDKKIINFCKKKDVNLTGQVWKKPLHKQPLYKKKCSNFKFKNADYFSNHHICPPNYPEMTIKEVNYVSNLLNEISKK